MYHNTKIKVKNKVLQYKLHKLKRSKFVQAFDAKSKNCCIKHFTSKKIFSSYIKLNKLSPFARETEISFAIEPCEAFYVTQSQERIYLRENSRSLFF